MLEPGERKKNFSEVELTISACAAIGEAKRCLRCDLEFSKTLERT
jgi:NADPH-dependent glutamate synthase beta subunit-like oxidoreductase